MHISNTHQAWMKSYNTQYQYILWYKQQKNITNDALFIKNAYLCVVCLIIYHTIFMQ